MAMTFPNIFTTTTADDVINRIQKLRPDTKPLWGKMSVAQMLAHCNVPYEMVYETKHPKPNALMRFFLTAVVKSTVTGNKPYKKNTRTAPAFLIKDERAFDAEQKRLIDHIRKTQQHGEDHFHNKESLSFGKLSKDEWNTMFYKHIDHHLSQFGV